MAATVASNAPELPAVTARLVRGLRVRQATGPLIGAAVALAYLGLAQYVIWLNDPVHAGAGYWPAAGLTLAALLLLPGRYWAWVLGGVVAAELGGDALHHYPLAASGWWAAGNAIEPLLAATLLRRFGDGGRLVPMRNVARFLVAGVLTAPLVGAAIGSVGTTSVYGTPRADVLFKWWVGDGLGVLVVAPLLLCFWHAPLARRSRTEAGVLALLTAAVSLLALRNWHADWDEATPYAVFPILMWASVRFGVRGAAVVGFVAAEMANVATALGYGPFHESVSGAQYITVLQLFLASALTAGLVIAALVTDTVAQTGRFERQRSVADALQETVLPLRLPTPPGLTLAARYLPSAPDATIHVGGDWYDAFELGDGTTALVVGDIAGHDLGAAVVMGQLRNGLRSLLFELRDPVTVMAALDRQLASGDEDYLASVVIALLRDGELTWVNAGHPPLLHVPAHGPAQYLERTPAPMIGVGGASYALHHRKLEPGDVIVGFTDGLIEHPGWSLDDGFAHLAEVVDASPSRDVEALCEVVLAEGLGGRSRLDDTCLLVVRLHG